ncbi:MAG: alpha-galactosidase [Acidobacteria bacterium]|nr:MAG: alpha-galactosidase [Acidobacteriota bacterium]
MKCVRSALFILVSVTVTFAASAQTVRFDSARKLWFLSTRDTSYVLGINEQNEMQHVYWGKRIAAENDFAPAHLASAYGFETREGRTAEEYPAWGGMRYGEPCLKVTFPDGNRDLVLKFDSQKIGSDILEITLKDISYGVFVTLRYRVFTAFDVIEKSVRVDNRTKEPIVVESAQSGVWHLPSGQHYRLSYLHGYWAGETRLAQEPIDPGKKILESRRGNTSGQANPWFAIDAGGAADEEHGKVWFGALGWSGNWKLVIEDTPYDQVRVVGGFNDFDFSYPLKPGESLNTPLFYGGYTELGFGDASRLMHSFEREAILPARSAGHLRPILYNSWEATEFNVDEAGQKALADKAARIGVELFVMDDGWFGQRNDDHAGLGDWYVNPQKFPNGLGPLIQYVKSKGMKFGLWVEPEMVNPNSNLYRKHPDWVINFSGRPRTEGRNQLVLNLARDDVKEYLLATLVKLLRENDIDFLKWDMNRHFSEPGWPAVAPADERKLWVNYVLNLYDIIDQLRAKYPKLEIESCSGGGGRIDLGILKRVEQAWTSDNTDAFDRLTIQDGFTHAYAPKLMMDWVTDVPNMNGRSTPLKFRFLAAMMGSMGIGANLNRWSDEDFALASKMAAYYKTIRATVQEGDLYRLASPHEGELTASQYVSRDGRQSVLFAFLRSQQFLRPAPTISLRGLDPNANYRVISIDDKLIDKADVLSGAYVMNHGLNFNLTGDFDSTSITLERVK